MATFSYENYPGDGSTDAFSIPFSYLNETDIQVEVDETPVSFTFLDSNTVKLDVIPTSEQEVRVLRRTSAAQRLVNFNDASTFTGPDINLSFDQALFVAQESFDVSEEGSEFAALALSTAISADDTSQQALTNANQSISDSDQAVTDSSNALSIANDADTKADNAVSTANDADTKADNAVVTANDAKDIAELALGVEGGTLSSNVVDNESTEISGTSITDALNNVGIELDGKAATSHTHAISDVTDLQTELDGKAATSHTHAISDVTGLQTELDASVRHDAAQSLTPEARVQVLDNLDLDLDTDNRIINGDFSVWQRGTSQTSGGYGSVDRYRIVEAGGTTNLSRQSFGLGDTIGGNLSKYYARYSVSGQTDSDHLAILEQGIEGVRSYAGQTITLLGFSRRSSGSGNVFVEFIQSFGSGGGSSGVNTPGGVINPGDGVWEPFAVVVTIPEITGKVLGPNGDDRFRQLFWFSGGSDFNARIDSLGHQTITVDLWGVHIRRGVWPASAALLYRPRMPGVELALCQRYYQTLPSVIVRGELRSSGDALYHLQSMIFPVTMRAGPSITGGAGSAEAGTWSLFTVGVSDNKLVTYQARCDAPGGATSRVEFSPAQFDAEF